MAYTLLLPPRLKHAPEKCRCPMCAKAIHRIRRLSARLQGAVDGRPHADPGGASLSISHHPSWSPWRSAADGFCYGARRRNCYVCGITEIMQPQ